MPGFAVTLVECASLIAFPMWVNTDGFASSQCFHRNHVPNVVSSNEDGDKVNFCLGIEAELLPAPVCDKDVESGAAMGSSRSEARFHLHARQAAAMLHQEIVRMAVAVGPRDPDAFDGCAIHERDFGNFAHALGAEMSDRHISFAWFQI